MSDDNWLRAMRRYGDDGYEHPEITKGGVRQLASDYAGHVKEEPERFYRLAHSFDDTICAHYVEATISGLAESVAPSEWVFDLVRMFEPRITEYFHRGVCRALQRRASDGVPDDLLDLMEGWALLDSDPEAELWNTPTANGEPYYGGDPYGHGINSNRGVAVRAACHCALQRDPAQFERIVSLLEQTVHDSSTAVRSCVVECLIHLLRYDEDRAIRIFENVVVGYPALLGVSHVEKFLYHSFRRHFSKVGSFIKSMLVSDHEEVRQTGARLSCLSAFTRSEANDLAHQALNGDEAMRRGAAQVYARNLGLSEHAAVCRKQLLVLMSDPDDQVRREVGRCFEYLRPEDLGAVREFIEAFLDSPALLDGAEHLLRYVKPLIIEEHDLALEVTSRILDAAGGEVTDFRSSRALLEADLVALPLTVYTHTCTTDAATSSRAMDLFERLLVLGSHAAGQALEDWDRR